MGYDHLLTDDDGKKKSIKHFNQLPCFPASYIPNIRAEIWEDQKALQLLVLTDLLSSPRDKIVPVQKWVDTWSQVRSVSHMSIRITGIAIML